MCLQLLKESADVCNSAQATHQLENREQLMGFLRKNPEGTHLGQVKDAYPGVVADITRLQKEVRGFPHSKHTSKCVSCECKRTHC